MEYCVVCAGVDMENVRYSHSIQEVCQIKGGPPLETITTTKEGLRIKFGQTDALVST